MTVIINWLGNTRAIELSSSFEIVFRPLRFDFLFLFFLILKLNQVLADMMELVDMPSFKFS